MTDLHTHILPGMDDGAVSLRSSILLLQKEWEEGVDRVALTPHFYHSRESQKHFLDRRAAAYDRLLEFRASLAPEVRRKLPAMILAAEVEWQPDLESWSHLEEFCYQKTKLLLVELPFYPWSEDMINKLYDLMSKTGLTPVIAHIDRYLDIQKKELLQELYSIGLPMQLSGEALLHLFTREKALRLLRDETAQYVISDCHNLKDRKPNMGAALDVVEKKLGKGKADKLAWLSDRLLFGE